MFNRIEGSFIATANIPDAATAFHGEPLSLLFGMCAGAMEFNNRVFLYRHDEPVRVNLNWIRDYILTLKGFRYTERDIQHRFRTCCSSASTKKAFSTKSSPR